MSTTNTDFLPNTTGLNLGSPDQRWDGFFDDITVIGSINGGLRGADSVQLIAISQAVDFANAINTMILATAGALGITLTLPSATDFAGRTMRFKKTDASIGFVTISGTIDHQASYVLSNRDQYVNLEAGDGTWQVVGNN